MRGRKIIAHKTVIVAGMILSVSALPFSLEICHAGMIAVLVAWLFEGQWAEKLRIVKNSILLQLLLAFLVVLAIGLTYSGKTVEGWFSLEKKIFFLLIPIALATSFIRLTKKEVQWIFYCFLLSCITGCVLCLLNAWQQAAVFTAGEGFINPYFINTVYKDLHPFDSEMWLIFSYKSLSDCINIHPTYFSLYLTFCILFLMHQLQIVKSTGIKIVFWFLVVFFSGMVIFLSSRIMILSRSIIFVFLLIHSLIIKQRSIAIPIVVLATLFLFLLFINPVSRYRSLQEITFSTFNIQPDNIYRSAAHIRFSLWWLGIHSLEPASLLWGSGTGDVKNKMQATGNRYRITNVVGSFDPHNQYLYTLIGNGVLGFLLLALYLGLPGYFAWLRKDFLFMGFSFLFLMLCFTESALEIQKGIGFYTIFLSLFAFHHNSFQHTSINLRPLIRAGN